MKKNTIACEPLFGWNGKAGNQSLVALEWLCWLNYEKRLQISDNMTPEEHEQHDRMAAYDPHYPDPRKQDTITHERIGGEHWNARLRRSVDGYEEKSNVVYQFHGCYWHGCKSCFRNRTKEHRRLGQRRMCDVYEQTLQKTRELKAMGYIVIEMWECQWNEFKKSHPDCQKYVDSLHFTRPLNPRDAFFGGRTNAAKLYHQCGPNEKIRYIDFTSLYPYINKTAEYPLEHPVIICHPETTDISEFFGIAKVRIQAPFNLYHPVLSARVENKLLFPLCRSCAEEEIKKPITERVHFCQHYDEQRELIGTWCTPELEKAVEKGYVIKEIYEVHHFHEHPPGLFKEYVNKWLKIKQQASGWPKWCTTEALKQKYIRDYYNKEGIQLEYSKIIKNDGLRNIAKLMLNSMWGKFGQALNKAKHKQIQTTEELYHYLDSDEFHIKKFDLQKNDQLTLYFDMMRHSEDTNPNVNVYIAAFTTCWARLKLYNTLEKLGKRVLYYDTDSIIYVETENSDEFQPELGDYLGDFTDELYDKNTGESHYITEFCSAGPKNYGYRCENGKVKCKVKGFRLNAETYQQLNYEAMRNNLLKELEDPQDKPRVIHVNRSYAIKRNPVDFSLTTVPENKKYRMVYDKRVIDYGSYETYPYGYTDLTEADFDSQMGEDINTLLDL